jgi:hypothetical protein
MSPMHRSRSTRVNAERSRRIMKELEGLDSGGVEQTRHLPNSYSRGRTGWVQAISVSPAANGFGCGFEEVMRART